VVAQGRAAAAAVTALLEAYKASGVKGRDALLLQKLVPVFDQLASTLREIKVDRLVILGPGNGTGSVSAVKSIISANEQVRAATGVDLMAPPGSRWARRSSNASSPASAKPLSSGQRSIFSSIGCSSSVRCLGCTAKAAPRPPFLRGNFERVKTNDALRL
jgi:hypothetical protein